MSQYINFYVRINDNFAPIGSYSRSSEIYQTAHHRVPYEHITPLRVSDFDEMIKNIEERIDTKKKDKKYYLDMITLVMNANNSIGEKMEEVDSLNCSIREIKESIEELEGAMYLFSVYSDMIEDYQYSGISYENDYSHYIYAGIEANGTLEDVIE